MEQKLLNKNGIVTVQLAKMFMTIEKGSRIPTFTEMVNELGVARGTVQNSVDLLERKGAIELESRGHLGTFLIRKDIRLLLELGLVQYLAGVMPLPYSRRYEGLATGIISSVQNEFDIPVNMSYMQGAKKRISMLMNNRYDFAIVSEYAAKEAITEGQDIEVVLNFGEKSYLNAHVLAFHDATKTEVESGMRVGIDVDSIDQENITKLVCGDATVQYVKLGYNQIIEKILKKEIDVAVWNEDELRIHRGAIHIVPINRFKRTEDTSAVIIINQERVENKFLLQKMVNVEKVLQVQSDILANKIVPSY